MQFLRLLGKKLKDDEVIEVLEEMDMEVTYDFDRLHEGQPDIYWATSNAGGFQFRFDEAQTLDVVFLYIRPLDGFTPIAQGDCDVPLFATAAEVHAFGEAQRSQVAEGRADLLGVARDWVRLGFGTHSIHYEFREGILAVVTISRNDEHRAG